MCGISGIFQFDRERPVDRAVLEAGSFGLVHQFGVGLEQVDIARATELGVLVCRVPGDAGGNADSVAEIAVAVVPVRDEGVAVTVGGGGLSIRTLSLSATKTSPCASTAEVHHAPKPEPSDVAALGVNDGSVVYWK